MKTYFGLENPPVNIVKFAIGDGTLGSTLTFEYVPTVSISVRFPPGKSEIRTDTEPSNARCFAAYDNRDVPPAHRLRP